MAGNNATPGQSVAAKIFLVLDAFSGDRTVLSMSDIARYSGVPSSTVHRLIQDMVAWGGLERLANGKYTIGLKLWEIAARSSRSYGLREAAMPLLQSLWETTKAHVVLAIMEHNEVLFIERITGTRDVPPARRPGGRIPLHASSTGKILLAYADTSVQDEVLASPLPAYTPRTITSPQLLRLELERIRRNGVAISEKELNLDSVSCAAPIFGPPEMGVATVSILCSPGSRNLEEMKTLVQMAGRGITHVLANPVTSISPPLGRITSRLR